MTTAKVSTEFCTAGKEHPLSRITNNRNGLGRARVEHINMGPVARSVSRAGLKSSLAQERLHRPIDRIKGAPPEHRLNPREHFRWHHHETYTEQARRLGLTKEAIRRRHMLQYLTTRTGHIRRRIERLCRSTGSLDVRQMLEQYTITQLQRYPHIGLGTCRVLARFQRRYCQ